MKSSRCTPKIYWLVFTLTLTVLFTNLLYSQTGNPANFSIRGGLYSGTPTSNTDDWFKGPSGSGMIIQTQTATFLAYTNSKSNTPFTARQAFLQYSTVNGYLLYDAIYARDYINMVSSSNNDLTAFNGGVKNGDNPVNVWNVIPTNVGGNVDIVDAYAHLRRSGVTVGQNLWLNMGVSTLDESGEHFVDFELFAEPLTVSGGSFVYENGANLNATGGHSPWIFNGSGTVTRSGDMVAGFSFNGETVSNVELRIWTSRTTFDNITPVGFSWGPEFDGATNTAAYGYAQIIIPSGGKFNTGSSTSITGPPWRTFVKGGPDVSTTYSPGGFAEVALNLSAIGIDPSLKTGNACDAPFTKILIKSRSSSSFTSQLKDFAGPYAFLGAPTVDTTIKDPGYFTCTKTQLTLEPQNPYTANHYYNWTTTDGEFLGGSKAVSGESAIITKPGTYKLTAAPLLGCTETSSTIIIYAQPCAIDDYMGEVVQNKNILPNHTVAYNVLTNDTDLDNNIVVGSISNTSLLQPANGTVSIDTATGVITYTPNANFYGTDTFEYRICDSTPVSGGGPLCDVALVTVTVLKDTDSDGVADKYDIDNDNDGIPDITEGGQISGQPDCGSATPLNFTIRSIEFDNGAGNIVGDIFRYSNVKTGIDALVTIKATVNASVPNIDDNATNPTYFQPQTTHTALAAGANAHVEYKFDFVLTGTTTPVVIPEFFAYFNDIDGSTAVKEQNWSEFPESYSINNPTELTVTKEGTWLKATSGIIDYPGATHNYPQVNMSTGHLNKSSYSIRVGVFASSAISSSTRLHVVEFNCPNNFTNPVTFNLSYDLDGDGIPNYLDLDSDNDGIPDVLEAGLTDANNDGLVDTTSYGVNGLADNVETSPDSGIINYTIRNTDAASDISPGMYNFLDVDSDNDGITDTTEAFSNNASYKDVTNNGIIDGFTDTNKNGWHDAIDAEATFPTQLNSDSDAIPNYLDLDSDGDGLPDTFEGNFQVIDGENDGIVGTGIPSDIDGDGLADTNDPDFAGNILGGFGFNKDRDNDGVKNYLDIDVDNDGIIDNIEGQPTFSYRAPTGTDTDGDGIDNAYDVGINPGYGIGYTNTDGGSAPDYADTDAENDLIFDILENNIANNLDDANSDGVLDSFVDTDGDGLANVFDLISGTTNPLNATNNSQTPLSHPDLDPAGGDRDWREGTTQDYDKDGIPDLVDLDDDNDGILDTVEDLNLDLDGDPRSNPTDTDGDGIPNYFDLDSDGDGLTDTYEAGGTFDADGSGMPGTGILTTAQVGAAAGTDYGVPLQYTLVGGYTQIGLTPPDTDGDGIPNYLDLDSDNDGISDVLEAGGVDGNGDGLYGSGAANDSDADGLSDAVDPYHNSTLLVLGTPLTTLVGGYHQAKNTDGDGYPNFLDLDSDNDTIPDNVEAQTTLGYVAPTGISTDKSGIDDSYDVHFGATIVPVDTDGDGTPDYLDLNSDGDALYDIVEASVARAAADTDNNGMTNNPVGTNGLDNTFDNGDTYADPNGSLDNTQFDNFKDADADVKSGGDVDYRDVTFNDNDNDGIPDAIDLDDDNDGILDTVESNGVDPLIDSDSDGISDYLDAEYCASQISTLNSFGVCSYFDKDDDGIPNFFDLDSDADGCSDAIEAGATTNPVLNYRFPASPVGTDGVPNAVQNAGAENSGTVNYTVIQTNAGTYDFLDATLNIACKADLSLTKTVSNATPNIGDTITFTLTVTNSGPYSTSGIRVKDILPIGLNNISFNTTSGTYNITTGIWDFSSVLIEIDNSVTLGITATVGPNCGPITNKAEIISSDRSDPDSIPNNQK